MSVDVLPLQVQEPNGPTDEVDTTPSVGALTGIELESGCRRAGSCDCSGCPHHGDHAHCGRHDKGCHKSCTR
jgi:hypothetical protein